MRIKNILIPDAPIAIVYSMPSTESEAKAKDYAVKKISVLPREYHFNSKSEAAFTLKLAKACIQHTKCSILSIIQERYYNASAVSSEELECWKALFLRELKKISPTLIISVGEIATRVLLNSTEHPRVSVSDKYRGYICQSPYTSAKILVTQDILHTNVATPEWHPLMEWDLAKAKRNSLTKESLAKDLKIHITNDLELIEREFLSPEFLEAPDSLLAFDIECAGCEMTCIGFSKHPNVAYTIPLNKLPPLQLAASLRMVGRVLASPVPKVAQNGNFDVFYLAHYYKMPVNNFVYDTMLMMHSLYSNLPKGLDTLGSIFTEESSWKSVRGWKED